MQRLGTVASHLATGQVGDDGERHLRAAPAAGVLGWLKGLLGGGDGEHGEALAGYDGPLPEPGTHTSERGSSSALSEGEFPYKDSRLYGAPPQLRTAPIRAPSVERTPLAQQRQPSILTDCHQPRALAPNVARTSLLGSRRRWHSKEPIGSRSRGSVLQGAGRAKRRVSALHQVASRLRHHLRRAR
jgi:hypothetical protein